VDPRLALQPHRVGYLAAGGLNVLNSGVKRFDFETGATQFFDFGSKNVVGEPVFVAKPDGRADEGWLISQVLNGDMRKSFFAIFDAESVGAGPIAKVQLDHSLPISFHGWWRAA
jgi:all-trans-8'-apo-beta-carotenal 15,15'-oxygenase